MSGIGGFIFRGYRCVKDPNDTVVSWTLKVHKTRVKAFIEASNAANAGWQFDKTDGAIAFENVPGAIHSVDNYQRNLVTFFKNGDDAYTAICTFGLYHGTGITPSGKDGDIEIAVSDTYYDTATVAYITGSTVQYVRVSCFQIVNNIPMDINGILNASYPCKLMSVGNQWVSANMSLDVETTVCALQQSNLEFGYAVKNKHFMSFCFDSTISNNVPALAVWSCDAYKELLKGNSCKCFSINFEYKQQEYQNTVSNTLSSSFDYILNSSFSETGKTYVCRSSASRLYANGIIYSVQPCSDYAIGSISVAGNKPSGFFGIGTLKTDLIGLICTDVGALPNKNTLICDGNYLIHQASNLNTGAPRDICSKSWNAIFQMIVVGYDSSNPDPNLSTSWIEYDLSGDTPQPEPEPEPSEATKARGQFPVLSIEAASVGVDGDEIYVTFQKSNPHYGDSYIDFSAYDTNGNLYVTSSAGNLSTDEPITAEKLNAFHDDGNNPITNYMTFSGVLDPASVPEYDEDPLTIQLSGGSASAKATGAFAKVPADLEVEAADSGSAGNSLMVEIYDNGSAIIVDIYNGADEVFSSHFVAAGGEYGTYVSADTLNELVDDGVHDGVAITDFVLFTGDITVSSEYDSENPIVIQLSGGEDSLT